MQPGSVEAVLGHSGQALWVGPASLHLRRCWICPRSPGGDPAMETESRTWDPIIPGDMDGAVPETMSVTDRGDRDLT